MNSKKRVVVALSGGVDSSVAAALLKERGYDVIGITMRLWFNPEAEVKAQGGCCSLDAIEDARRVAARLDIPYYVLDFKEEFYKYVVEYFIDEYRLGRTPNPCIACNRYIKFEALLNRSFALEADYVATGHYARVVYDKTRGRFLLKTAADSQKDQTYMLYNLSQQQLKHVIFPLGDFYKRDVRQIAARLNLPVAKKEESQEICFIPDNDYRKFLRQLNPELVEPGPIVDTAGRRLGTHRGVSFYTVGQRKGLGLAVGKPLYVVNILPEVNTIIVGSKEETYSRGLRADNVNLISVEKLEKATGAEVKIRYQAPKVPAVVFPQVGESDDEEVEVRFCTPLRAVTPGQAVVFYQGEEVLGGATIRKRLN